MNSHGERHIPRERQSSQERLDVASEAQKNLEHMRPADKTAEKDPFQQSVDALKARVDQEAKSTHEYSKRDTETTPSQSFMLHRNLKNDAYKHTLQKARRHLSAPERLFSRVVHQPTVETSSEIAAKTIGRASGLFMGSLFAFLGSAFLLYMSKKYGFTYNYGVFLLCFIGGFALGLLVELAWRTVRRKV